MSSIKELQSDLLCHLTEDGGIRLNKLEALDLFRRLADIRETEENLRTIISKPLVSLVDDFEIMALRKAEGE